MQKDKPSLNAKGKARLQLKGRIYMANVTDIVCLQKPGKHYSWSAGVKKNMPLIDSNRTLPYSDFLERRPWCRR